jgi:glycosyltransferase involved in cell wall biosynthesis
VTSVLAVLVPVLGAPTETFVRRHVEGLAPGSTVVIAVRDERPRGDRDGTPVLELAALLDEGSWIDRPDVIGAAVEFLEAHRVTAVLAEFLDVWTPLVPAIAAAGMRVVAHGFGYDVSSRLRDPGEVERYRCYRDVGAPVVVPSRWIRDRLVSLDLWPTADVFVVPCGVAVVQPLPRIARSAGGVKCLAVGRMVAKKAPIAMLEAFAAARATLPERALTLDVVGEGPLLDDARLAIARLGLDAASVSLLGTVDYDEVRRLMAASDLFLQHSVVDEATGDEEGLPVAILDAMAAGLPVVSTRHAGIPEAVIDSETGVLVAEGDVEAMADAIVTLAGDPHRRARFGEAGRRRVEERFTWSAERAALLDVLQLRETPRGG